MGMMRNTAKYIFNILRSVLPPAQSIKLQHLVHHGKLPNLRNPQTFNEKVQYRKLNENDPRFVECSDKVRVKDYVATILGEAYVIPTIWSGREVPDAPDPQWGEGACVIKANHASGWNVFVPNIQKADWQAIKQRVNAWVKTPWLPLSYERWYARIEPQILIEPDISENGVVPVDYKFFVFGGRVGMVQVDTDRFSEHKRTLFDRQGHRLTARLQHSHDVKVQEVPEKFTEMVELAERLGAGFDFVRIDLYDTKDGVKFGEMTFAPGGGLERFYPFSFDQYLGSMWHMEQALA